MKVLIVDDEADVREYLSDLLRAWSYEPILADSAMHAQEILSQPNAPQILILDVMLPEIDGYTFCRQLRAKHADVLYILMITCLNGADDMVAGFKAGTDDFLIKPFAQEELQCRLRVGARTVQYQNELARKNRMLDKEVSHRQALVQQLEEQTQRLMQSDRLAQVGTMLATWIHEVNNPLLLINANIQLLSRYWETMRPALMQYAQTAEHVDDRLKVSIREMPPTLIAVREGMRRIDSLVRRMRDQTNASSNWERAADINQCVTHVSEMMAGYFKNAIEAELTLAENLPVLSGYTEEIEQALMNLLINACHALAETQEARIHISTRMEEDALVVEILDNGPGIPLSLQKKIWEPFFSTKGDKGTGLGLFIVRSIIEKHSGSIDAQVLPAESPWRTQFVLRLPAGARDEPKKSTPSSAISDATNT